MLIQFAFERAHPLNQIFFQRDELNEERRKVISDQAKKLIRDEPSVLEAAEKEFKGILNYFTSRFCQLITHIIPSYSKRVSFSRTSSHCSFG